MWIKQLDIKEIRIRAAHGLMYDNAYGVSRDYIEAMKWYRKASDQGNSNAQENIGVMYENGDGVDKDLEQAVRWYKTAAAQGVERAKNNVDRIEKKLSGPMKGKICQTYQAVFFKSSEALSACSRPDGSKNLEMISTMRRNKEAFYIGDWTQVIVILANDNQNWVSVRELGPNTRWFYVHKDGLRCPWGYTPE